MPNQIIIGEELDIRYDEAHVRALDAQRLNDNLPVALTGEDNHMPIFWHTNLVSTDSSGELYDWIPNVFGVYNVL
jgi:hypothetical protein